jgi:CRISPR-associated protein Cas2
MRRRYIVCYDICDETRLRRVAKVIEGFGFRMQYSVFQCDLNETNLIQMRQAVENEIHAREDQVPYIDVGPADSPHCKITSSGRGVVTPSRGCVVV